jgi:hypothetical protein
MMQTSPESASRISTPESYIADSSRHASDLAYQAMTIAAMLLLLGSLWVL